VEILTEPHEIFVDSEGLFGERGHAEWMAFIRDSEGNTVDWTAATRQRAGDASTRSHSSRHLFDAYPEECGCVGTEVAIYGATHRTSYEEKLSRYRSLADAYFEIDRYQEFCSTHLANIDEVILGFVGSQDFDNLLVDTVRSTFPPNEHERFVGHYRGLLGAWATNRRA
jgi:hypothetical protein